ncbi:hypothetical protein KSP40_PGU013176 [Platanthera guangdongensis]|uniref:Uncharacterized protein n=1 Tax=Platanthera guangdongensis TaxID=2320717 RepID=A0ABR2LMX8_9ASPA
MEVGRDSSVSNNDFQERRKTKTKTKKKFGSLPLGVFLSFNDRGVHPKCPNASNSYHKCGRHCFDKIPPEGDSDRGKKFEKEGVNPNCPNASNPYHKCAEYCLENLQDQPAMKPKEEKKGGLATDRLVKFECKFASNPYHVCAEYCLESVPTRDLPEQTMRLKSSREVKMAPMKKERTTGSPPPCKHKSIPYHECTEICLQSAPNRNFAKREKPNGDSVKSDKRNAHLNRSASVPFHTVTEYCLEDTLEKEHPKRAIKPKEESDIVTTFRVQNVPDRKINEGENPEGVSITTDNTSEHHKPKHLSSPHQKMTEYFFEDTAGKELPEGEVKLEEEIEVVRSLPEREHHEGFLKSKEDKAVDLLERGLSSRQNVPKARATLKAKEEKKVFSSLPRMNSECKNASNPYHKCAEFCNEIVLERDQPGKTFTRSKQKERVDFPSEGAVNPDCQFASNPYHVCAEYCFENVPKREKRWQGMELKGLKELKNLLSNKKITSGQPQCNFASNPYHKCTEYCLNSNMPDGEIIAAIKTNERKKDNNYSTRRDVDPIHKHPSKKNEEAEGIKATFKEKTRDSSLGENKRDHLIMERKSSASSSSQDDGMKKRSAESKHVDASNPINDKFDSRGATKDLHSAKVVDMNLKEPADVQLTDSSDILHEWTKYCSQKCAVDVGMPVPEKIANVEGEVFLKEYASGNQKVQTNGRLLACSLPISLLFLLGFVLSAVHRIQMIHSFIVSPEKFKGGGEKMKAEGDGDRECRIVSDPYHICADCCSQGSDE